MKVALIINSISKHDLAYRDYIANKLKAIGCEVEFVDGKKWQAFDADVLAVVFDGHDLSPVNNARIGWFKRLVDETDVLPKKMIVGYEYAKGSDEQLKSSGLFNHLAKTEINLIYCLKDYIFYYNRTKK